MISSRSIEDLQPIVKEKLLSFISECHKEDIEILITSTYRDIEKQNALYAIGRTVIGSSPTPKKPMGNILTNAKGGQSFHNFRVAFDWVPLIHGKAVWNDINMFTHCGLIAESCGLEWAGRWKTFKEYGHCQFTRGNKIEYFRMVGKI